MVPQEMPQQGLPCDMPQAGRPLARQSPSPGVTPVVPGGYQIPRLRPPSKPATPTGTAQAAAETQPPRVVRGVAQRGEVAIPTPEELGIAPAQSSRPAPVSLDWSLVRRQLNDCGVTRFQLDQQSNRIRFTCWVGQRQVVGDGSNEAEAVQHCLEQIQRSVAGRR